MRKRVIRAEAFVARFFVENLHLPLHLVLWILALSVRNTLFSLSDCYAKKVIEYYYSKFYSRQQYCAHTYTHSDNIHKHILIPCPCTCVHTHTQPCQTGKPCSFPAAKKGKIIVYYYSILISGNCTPHIHTQTH